MKTELKTHALWNTLLCHNMMAQLPIDLFMQVKKFRQQSISYQNLFNHNFAFFNVGEFATLSLQASSFVFWFVHSFINSFIGSFDRSVFSSLPMWVIRSSCQPPSSFVRAFVRDIFRSSYCSFLRICLSIRSFIFVISRVYNTLIQPEKISNPSCFRRSIVRHGKLNWKFKPCSLSMTEPLGAVRPMFELKIRKGLGLGYWGQD